MDGELQAARFFGQASMLAMAGWLVLLVSIALHWRKGRDLVAGIVIPSLLSLGYVAIIATDWSSAKGGFSSLSEVSTLFQSPWMLLAGWVHYLAFDLFIGAWIARDADEHGVSRWVVIPVMPVTLFFGPMGLVAWLIIRLAHAPLILSPNRSFARENRQ
ncbi:MAG: ABA4-like family protein [Rhodospirillales bacterium]|jgi:hypothetical protein